MSNLCLTARVFVPGHADHTARPGGSLLVLGVLGGGDETLFVEGREVLCGRGDIDLFGGNRLVGQDRDDVVADLRKAAVGEVGGFCPTAQKGSIQKTHAIVEISR
jgi:hypothetical protein